MRPVAAYLIIVLIIFTANISAFCPCFWWTRSSTNFYFRSDLSRDVMINNEINLVFIVLELVNADSKWLICSLSKIVFKNAVNGLIVVLVGFLRFKRLILFTNTVTKVLKNLILS